MKFSTFLLENEHINLDKEERFYKEYYQYTKHNVLLFKEVFEEGEALRRGSLSFSDKFQKFLISEDNSLSAYVLDYIDNPILELQQYAIRNFKPQIATSSHLIRFKTVYEDLIKRIYKDNELMINKWIRYREAMMNAV